MQVKTFVIVNYNSVVMLALIHPKYLCHGIIPLNIHNHIFVSLHSSKNVRNRINTAVFTKIYKI